MDHFEDWPDGWRNRLIWGDNKYILSSLLDEFAGKVDLIYIDPPFATGADFSYNAEVGDVALEKLPGAIEELAYRDTWRDGMGSYCQMMWERLRLAYDLMSTNASIYLHCDPTAGHYLKAMMDEIWGKGNFRNEIIWKRTSAHANARKCGSIHDIVLFYSKSDAYVWNDDVRQAYDRDYIEKYYRYKDDDGRLFMSETLTAPSSAGSGRRFEWKGVVPPPTRAWAYSEEKLDDFEQAGKIFITRNGIPRLKRYLDEQNDMALQDMWTDIEAVRSWHRELVAYPTQKPEALLERTIGASCNPGDLVLDFFVGSGTTLAAAEKLGRRWIGADLGRYAIHTARKRLLDIPDCRPFEVQNLGRYERRRWQGATAGERIGEYYRFILDLYGARSVRGFASIHGERAGRMVHVGATDAPVTNVELRAAIEECVDNGLRALDVLGWEWEMGLNPAGRNELAAHYGVDVHLYNIPHEVMDKRAVEAGDVHFFELSVAEVEARVDGREATLELTGFLPALDDYMREKTEGKIARWSDWIDYWSVDYEYDGETFVNQWQAYRTRREPRLALRSDPHAYAPGRHTAVAKVIDIFGNDTTCKIAVVVE